MLLLAGGGSLASAGRSNPPRKSRTPYSLYTAATQSLLLNAQALFISQPALSKQLAELEDRLGFALFNRTRKAMLPTEAGAAFNSHAQRILDGDEQGLRVVPIGERGFRFKWQVALALDDNRGVVREALRLLRELLQPSAPEENALVTALI